MFPYHWRDGSIKTMNNSLQVIQGTYNNIERIINITIVPEQVPGQVPTVAQPGFLPNTQAPMDTNAMLMQALKNPQLIAQLASSDPDNVAASLVAAVKDNPVLQAAVVSAFEKSG